MVLNKCPISLQMVEVQFVLLQFRTVFFYLTVKSKCVGHRSIFKRTWHQIKLAAFCGNYFLAKMKVKNPGKLTFSSSLTHFSSGWFFFLLTYLKTLTLGTILAFFCCLVDIFPPLMVYFVECTETIHVRVL